MAERSERCPECLRAHTMEHPHVEQYHLAREGERSVPTPTTPTPATRKSSTVDVPRSPSPERSPLASEIAGNKEDVIRAASEKQPKAVKKTKQQEQLDLEEQRQRRAFLENLARETVSAEAMLPTLLTGDPRWNDYLVQSQERVESLVRAYVLCAEAWGVDFSGKYTSILALLMVHSTVYAQIYQRIAQEDASAPTPSTPESEIGRSRE